jgi:hypothetical protein
MTRPPAPLEWARRIALSHGHRDGTRITIDLSQSELARRESVSTGTVAYYLDRLGHLILSRRPIVLDAEALGVDEPPAAHPDTTTLAAVLHAVAALQAAHAQLTDALAGLVAANDFANIREIPRELANGFANLRETEQTDSQIENYLSDSLTREPREQRRELREEVREPANDDRHLEIDELIAPLVRICERRRLVGITNRTRLHAALLPYDSDQIRHAVELLTSQIDAGIPIHSPIGLLVRIAQQGDTTYFPNDSSLRLTDRHDAEEASVDEVTWPEECTEDLDREIGLDLGRLPTSVRARLLADTDGLHRLRSATYQARDRLGSPPR